MATKKKASVKAKSKPSGSKKAPKQVSEAPIPAAATDIPEAVREFLKATSIPKDSLIPKRLGCRICESA
jgi:hypothetical protein